MIRLIAGIFFVLIIGGFSALNDQQSAIPDTSPTPTATATPTDFIVKDQDTCHNPRLGRVTVTGLVWKAQTFVPQVTGDLVRVSVPGDNLGGQTTLHIRETNNGVPNGPDIGSSEIVCGNVFRFAPGVPLSAGTPYALVLSNISGRQSYQWEYSDSSQCYPNPAGYPFTSLDGGAHWGADIVDFYFTTYMIPTIPTGVPALDVPDACEPNSPVRGVVGDRWADVIIGQPDFTEITPHEVVPYKVFNPGGVTVDRTSTPGRAYVWDSGNSRILGLDLAQCYAQAGACTASIVIGQPSGYGHSACNGDSGFQRYPLRAPASASTLCGIPEHTLSILESKSFVGMAVDHDGNLYVPDSHNHRVLKYLRPFETDTIADEVWGQADFTGNECNRDSAPPTAESLCFHSAWYGDGTDVALDSQGNLWVADGGNNRVLRFPRTDAESTIAKVADLVLGQPTFASNEAGQSLDRMSSPSALDFGPDMTLYVADESNDRVLVFRPPFTSGMQATSLFGSNLDDPLGLEVDPGDEGVWIYDRGNSMLEMWDWDGRTVRKVVGKDVYRLGFDWGSTVAASGGGFGFDAQGNLLVPGYVYTQDVQRYAAPIPAPQPGVTHYPDRGLFSPPYGYNHVSMGELREATGMAVWGNQLIVSDGPRLLFWNGLESLQNGELADGMIGSPEFSYFPTNFSHIEADRRGRLWVETGSGGVDLYYLPLSNASKPTTVFAPKTRLPVLGGGELQLSDAIINGFAPSADSEYLWVSDTLNSRVIRIRNPLSAPLVDVILGQVDPGGTQCNRGILPAPNGGPDMLCYPSTLALDRFDNLYVSDHALEVRGNFRLLMFKNALFPQGNAVLITALPATKIFPVESSQPGIAWMPGFDSMNHMAVGYNGYVGGRFIGLYEDPLGPDTGVSGYLLDFSSMPYAAVFDARDNLYVSDANRSRVLIYRNPFGNPTPESTPTSTPSATASTTPTPTLTPTATKTLTPTRTPSATSSPTGTPTVTPTPTPRRFWLPLVLSG